MLRRKLNMNLYRRIVRNTKLKWRLMLSTKGNLKRTRIKIERSNKLKKIRTLRVIIWNLVWICKSSSHQQSKEEDDEQRELKRDIGHLFWAIKDEVISNIQVVLKVKLTNSISSRSVYNSIENFNYLTITFKELCMHLCL